MIFSQFDWNFVPEDSVGFFAPFRVSLVDSQGETVMTKRFLDNRIFYIWEEINIRAKYVHIDTISNSSKQIPFVHTCRLCLSAAQVFDKMTDPVLFVPPPCLQAQCGCSCVQWRCTVSPLRLFGLIWISSRQFWATKDSLVEMLVCNTIWYNLLEQIILGDMGQFLYSCFLCKQRTVVSRPF